MAIWEAGHLGGEQEQPLKDGSLMLGALGSENGGGLFQPEADSRNKIKLFYYDLFKKTDLYNSEFE